jgi:hypothetical protein
MVPSTLGTPTGMPQSPVSWHFLPTLQRTSWSRLFDSGKQQRCCSTLSEAGGLLMARTGYIGPWLIVL